jgi:hypothetical protein
MVMGGRGVAEHLLDDLDVRTGRDRQQGGRVPQLVRVQPGHADGSRCGIKATGAEHRDPQRAPTPHTAEHQVVGVLAGDVRRDPRYTLSPPCIINTNQQLPT